MSYDLFFFKKADNATTKNEIKNYLNQIPHITSNKLDTIWEYHNKETEAYCQFEMKNSNPKIKDHKSEPFEGFETLELSFNINYIRPVMFGEECFPLVDKMARALNLFISNPQDDEFPQKYDKGELEKEWREFNANLARMNKPGMSIFERYLYGIY